MCLAKITFKVTAVIGERPSSRIKGKKEKKEAGGGGVEVKCFVFASPQHL